MNKLKTFKIVITKQNTIQCFLIDSENKEEIIQIQENQNEYIPSILFDKTTIHICPNNTNINIIKDLFDEPYNYRKYSIEYQLQKYQVIFEVLFGLIINEFKEKIKKEYNIENTIVEVASRDFEAIRRIQMSLETLNLPNIEINPTTFAEYEEQGDKMYEILRKKESYQQHLQKIKNLDQFATGDQIK